ncbi:MAG: hypothetical protein BWY89_00680 [Bacteroidetes bacterium ADurb.BinA012]|nr:MAG: hypothetical protein BWY89_00680 [Bacteroidetes bacterium ADurb.BinA012]
MIICHGFNGDTSSTSMVPYSFSRTMVTEVINAHISMRMSVMTPGMNMKWLFRPGLKYIRTSGTISGSEEVTAEASDDE